MKTRRGSLFYKILLIFILLSIFPTLLTSARLLTLNNKLLEAGGANWALPAGAVQLITRTLTREALSYLAYTLMIIGLLAIFASGSLIGPIRQLQQSLERFRSGKLVKKLEIHSGDEVEQLAESFNLMAEDLLQLQYNLKDQVAERTRALEHRAVQLQAAASVGRAAASIRDLDELLTQVTQLISEHFGYYHAGIFLLDDAGEFAVLKASNSEGGQRMLKQGHRLKVGETGLVGNVTATREPRIALNVGADIVHFKNPLLPDTRSEIALPLIVGDRLLGALDVQSTETSAFSEEDIAVLQTLADQVAVAIENARLFAENQKALAEAKNALNMSHRAYGELSRAAWENLLRSRPQHGYRKTENASIQLASGEWSPDLVEASQVGRIVYTGGPIVAIPIKIRDQVAGVIRLRKANRDETWSGEEIKLMETITEQLSMALESARLYQETRRRAERERMAGEITAKMRSTNDPNLILQTAVLELRQALQANRAQVLLHSVHPLSEAPSTGDNHSPDTSQDVKSNGNQDNLDSRSDNHGDRSV